MTQGECTPTDTLSRASFERSNWLSGAATRVVFQVELERSVVSEGVSVSKTCRGVRVPRRNLFIRTPDGSWNGLRRRALENLRPSGGCYLFNQAGRHALTHGKPRPARSAEKRADSGSFSFFFLYTLAAIPDTAKAAAHAPDYREVF